MSRRSAVSASSVPWCGGCLWIDSFVGFSDLTSTHYCCAFCCAVNAQKSVRHPSLSSYTRTHTLMCLLRLKAPCSRDMNYLIFVDTNEPVRDCHGSTLLTTLLPLGTLIPPGPEPFKLALDIQLAAAREGPPATLIQRDFIDLIQGFHQSGHSKKNWNIFSCSPPPVDWFRPLDAFCPLCVSFAASPNKAQKLVCCCCCP